MKTITFDETKWKLVPIEPTKEMVEAAFHASIQHVLDCIADPARSSEIGSEENCKKTHTSRYQSMISAAPEHKPKADEDGFIQCDGRPPVSGDVFVDVKFSNGAVVLSEWAEAWDWCKDGGLPYIVAYRISK